MPINGLGKLLLLSLSPLREVFRAATLQPAEQGVDTGSEYSSNVGHFIELCVDLDTREEADTERDHLGRR